MFSSVAQSCQTLCNPMDCSMPGVAVLYQLLELGQLMSIKLVIPSNHLILCHPLLLLPSIFPNNRVFSNESVLHISWPKYWRFNFSIVLPMNIQDWFPLGWLGGSPCSPRDSQEFFPTPQFKSINSSVLSFLYSPTLTSIHDCWKNHILTRWTFVGKVMSLLFNMLSKVLVPWKKSYDHPRGGGEGDDREWDDWMVSLIQLTWVWAPPGVGDGQGSLVCCSPWGCKESDMTEWLNWTELS